MQEQPPKGPPNLTLVPQSGKLEGLSPTEKPDDDKDIKEGTKRRIEELKEDIHRIEGEIHDFGKAMNIIFPKRRPTLGGANYDLGEKHLADLKGQLGTQKEYLAWEQDAFYNVSKK